MKLIATQWVSDQLPKGAIYEAQDDLDGNVLIATGLFRRADDVPVTAPDALPPQASAQADAKPDEKPRRSYRRRDMTAEG